MSDVTYLALSAVLAWLMIVTGVIVRFRAWTPEGLRRIFENREEVPALDSLGGRAQRAAGNMIENLVLFLAVVAAVHFAGKSGSQSDTGAAVFFWARVAYWPVYLAGITYVRTALWLAGVAGMAIIVLAMI